MTEHRRRYEVNMEHVQHTGASYDRSDLGARGIIGFLIGMAVTVLLIHVIIWGFMRTYAHFEEKPLPRTSAMIAPAPVKGEPTGRFPAPQLQSDETGDMDKYREQVEQQLNSSGWVDQTAGVTHIPVERAMELVEQRGLPVRPPATQANGTKPRGNK